VSIGKEFTTSAIMSPNEVRQLIGLKPSDNPESDDLRNRNVDSNSPESTEEPDASYHEEPDEESSS
jgi:hypothetical protein